MSFEIGPLPRLNPLAAVGPQAPGAACDSAEPIPALPPDEVLDEIGAAADRADELWADGRELHFRNDEASGRVIVEVRDLTGRVIRTISPSESLGVLSGAAL